MRSITSEQIGGVLRAILAAGPPYLVSLFYGFGWGAGALVSVVLIVGAWSWLSKKRIQLVDR